MKTIFFIILFSYISCNCFAQSKKIDSLRSVLKNTKQDTVQVKTMNALAWEFKNIKPDTSIVIGNEALKLSTKLLWTKGIAKTEQQLGWFTFLLGDYGGAITHYEKSVMQWEKLSASADKSQSFAGKKGKASTIGNIGVVYKNQGMHEKALDSYFATLKIAEELGDKSLIANCITSIGVVYKEQGNYSKALTFHFKALQQAESSNLLQIKANNLCNIGNIYCDQAEFTKALDYYTKAVKSGEENGNKTGIARNLSNMGNVSLLQGDSALKMGNNNFANEKKYPEALNYFTKALVIADELHDLQVQAGSLVNIGGIYGKQGNHSKALENFIKGLAVLRQMKNKSNIASTLGNIATLYTETKKFAEAKKYLDEALSLSTESGTLNLMREHEFAFTELYTEWNKPGPALEHYKKFIVLCDSIFSKENKQQLIRSEMNYEYDKKKAVADAEHKSELIKQEAVAEEKSRKQNVIMLAVISCLLLVSGFLVFVFRSLRITRKQKLLIDIKNAETELQKHLIEEKQTEILDSIRYASRIQRALITSEKYIERNLNKLNNKQKK
ncbi:MAG: tetratricopeptide repeat protein [Bacteroidia bacterium]|nr:tetratricopeptide repeat protein [Bacteroidia bacterium]